MRLKSLASLTQFSFHFTDDNHNAFKLADMHPLLSIAFLFDMGADHVEQTMKNEEVQRLMNSGEKFDAVIVELFVVDALLGFGQHFNCPVIGVNTFDGVYWNDVYTGNQSPYSYVPMAFLGMPDNMSRRSASTFIIFRIRRNCTKSFSPKRQSRLMKCTKVCQSCSPTAT